MDRLAFPSKPAPLPYRSFNNKSPLVANRTDILSVQNYSRMRIYIEWGKLEGLSCKLFMPYRDCITNCTVSGAHPDGSHPRLQNCCCGVYWNSLPFQRAGADSGCAPPGGLEVLLDFRGLAMQHSRGFCIQIQRSRGAPSSRSPDAGEKMQPGHCCLEIKADPRIHAKSSAGAFSFQHFAWSVLENGTSTVIED